MTLFEPGVNCATTTEPLINFCIKWAIPGIFSFNFVFSNQLIVNRSTIQILLMTIFEPRTSGFRLSNNHCPLIKIVYYCDWL